MAGAVLLIWIGRRFRIRPPALFALYAAYYTFGRFFEELLRVDPSHQIAGLRLNAWVSIVVFVAQRGTSSGGSSQLRRDGPAKPARSRAASRRRRWPSRRAASGSAASLGACRWPCASSSWTSTRSKGPSTSSSHWSCVRSWSCGRSTSPDIVVAFVEHLDARGELDLDACGEFLVLISALLELKARRLFPEEEAELAELEPEEAAEELARRLAEYRRAKEAARWLVERLDQRRDLFFRLGPAPLRAPARAQVRAAGAGAARRRRSGCWRSSRRRRRRRTWRSASRRSRSSSIAGGRCCAAAPGSTSTLEVAGLSRVEVAVAFLALLELRKQDEIAIAQAAPFAPIRISRADSERSLSWTVRSA